MKKSDLLPNPCEHCNARAATVERLYAGPALRPSTAAEALRCLAHQQFCTLTQKCEHSKEGLHWRLDLSPVLGGEGCSCEPVAVKAKPGPAYYAALAEAEAASKARLAARKAAA